MNCQTIIPMAGLGMRFRKVGLYKPKPLLPVGEKMIIERILESIPSQNKIYLVLKKELSRQKEVKSLLNDDRVVFIESRDDTRGATCTALLAREFLCEDIPLAIMDSDTIFSNEALKNYFNFCSISSSDACMFTFSSTSENYSYVKQNPDGLVTQVVEKEVISNQAIAGAYWFKNAKYFVDSAIRTLIYDKQQKGEFYLSGAMQEMVKTGYEVRVFQGTGSDFINLGTPADYLEHIGRLHQ